MDGTVLVADDDRTIRTVLSQALTRAGCKVHATSSIATLMRWVDEGRGDLVISDVVMPDGSGLDALRRIGEARPELPVIIISARNTIVTAIQAAEGNAYDYLPKPFDLPELMKRAARALSERRQPGGAGGAPAPEPVAEDLPLVGRTAEMQGLYKLVARVMNADLPVLVRGETGTGRSLIASAIHDFSDRRTQPFVVVSAADADTPDGIERLVARARGGTLVLDEVGDFPPEAQLRLARALDVLPDPAPRVVAIAGTGLEARLADGGFRSDLYYRLSGVSIDVPPLLARLEDIGPLAEHFLARIRRETGTAPRLAEDAVAALLRYGWPGNVRQLENVIRSLAVTAAGEVITAAEVEAVLRQQPAGGDGPRVGDGARLSDSVRRHLRRYFDLHGGELPPPGVYQRILQEVEVPLIEICLDATGGNQARAAELLGINRNTLRKKIADLDIPVTRRRRLM